MAEFSSLLYPNQAPAPGYTLPPPTATGVQPPPASQPVVAQTPQPPMPAPPMPVPGAVVPDPGADAPAAPIVPPAPKPADDLNFLSRIPASHQPLMVMATMLMRGGINVGEVFANALTAGLSAQAMLDENKITDADRIRKQTQDDQRFAVEQRGRVATTAKAEDDLEFSKLTRPQKIEKIGLEIANLKSQGKLHAAQILQAELENGNFDKAWRLKVWEAKQDNARGWAAVQVQRDQVNKMPKESAWQDALEKLARRRNPQRPGESAEAFDQRIANEVWDAGFISKANPQKEALEKAKAYFKVAESAEDIDRAKYIRLGNEQMQLAGGGVAGANTDHPLRKFNTMAEYEKAAAAGLIPPGTRVSIGGRLGTHQ